MFLCWLWESVRDDLVCILHQAVKCLSYYPVWGQRVVFPRAISFLKYVRLANGVYTYQPVSEHCGERLVGSESAWVVVLWDLKVVQTSPEE